MKREIKFRAWDEGQGKMVHNVRIPFLKGWIGDNAACCVNCLFENTSDRLEWMQFTGLHDKAGKEIYEGDLVKIWVSSTIEEWEHVETCEVVFKCGAFCIVNQKRSYSLYNKCKSQPLNKFFECELIGNIYEHPHLIQKEEA